MEVMGFTKKLKEAAGQENVHEKEPLALHTTFRVGGPADWFVYVQSQKHLKDILVLCRAEGMPFLVLGNGSNVLASDDGYRGVVLKLAGEFDTAVLTEEETTGRGTLRAGAGISLAKLSLTAGRRGFTGLEFAAGIPGTLGGGILMNAGAYGGELKDALESVDVLTEDGEVVTLSKEELAMSYRYSKLQEMPVVVLGARFLLLVRQRIQIFAIMESYKKTRQAKQPLEYPSAGSTFKRPEGHYAGKLIQDAGLKGYRIGGAEVSEKHAGFVINKEAATAEDICRLMGYIQKTVWEKHQVMLEPEVRFVGNFPECGMLEG